MPAAQLEGRRIHVSGTVQGVGFRPWVYRVARQAGITGRVRNDSSGVTIDAFGDETALARFLDALHQPPPAARIVRVDLTDIAPDPADGFEIADSEPDVDRRISIPPDLATCDDCLSEIFDRSNRRYRYAFTNCTNCGPRFTIIEASAISGRSSSRSASSRCSSCSR